MGLLIASLISGVLGLANDRNRIAALVVTLIAGSLLFLIFGRPLFC